MKLFFCIQMFLVTGDLTVKEDVDRIMDSTVKHYGRLDVLVNNAGATRARNIDTCTIEDLDWCYNVLVRSVFMMSKAAIPHLEKTKGAILNMSSLAGLRPVSVLCSTEFTHTETQGSNLAHVSNSSTHLNPSAIQYVVNGDKIFFIICIIF